MANENMEEWRLGPKVIDETVKVTKKFLEEHPEEVAKQDSPTGKIGLEMIAGFLGWNKTRVGYSLERLHLIDEGILDKEAVESMPSDNAARELVEAIKREAKGKAPFTKPKQKRIAKAMKEGKRERLA